MFNLINQSITFDYDINLMKRIQKKPNTYYFDLRFGHYNYSQGRIIFLTR